MKEKLSEALNEVRDEYIDQAAKAPKARRWAFASAIAAVLAVVILISSFADTWALGARAISQADYDKHSQVKWESARELGQQLQSFTAQSLTQILGSATQENKAFSPINLYMAMAVTAELSGGNSQLLELLNAADLEALRTQTNLVWNACYNDKNNQCLLANSVWLREDVDYNKEILDLLAENYFTSSYEANFGSTATNRAITSWLNGQTGNLLKGETAKINLPAETVFALYATVYYQAKWSDEFSALSNTKGIFHGTTESSCTFMNKQGMIGTYYWGEDYGAVTLSLKDGSTMWLILPDEDKTISDVLSAGEYLLAMCATIENHKSMKINLSLPKFDITSNCDLKQELQAMGVTDIFEREDCFASFLEGPAWISAVNQATRVAIDEKGVTAASYIEIPGAGAAMPPEEVIDFIVDRPFIFVITNRYDLPLFAGVVNQVS